MKVYGIIYKITNKVNGKIYIGQTKNGFDKRYNNYIGKDIEKIYKYHKYYKENNLGYNKHLFHSIEKYGFNAFEVDKEFDVAYSKEELDELEKKYIKEFNCLNPNGYNDETGGNKNKTVSEKTRQKQREVHKKENLSNETRRKMSEKAKNRNHSEETKKLLSELNKGKNNAMYGKTQSEETKKIIGKKAKERYKNSPHPRARAVWCEELQEVRLMAKDWTEELRLSGGEVTKCCKAYLGGKIKRSKGYHFRYATEEEIKEYKLKHKLDK